MNKYMLLAAVCVISQGLSAQVALNVKVNDHLQTICLDQEQQETCIFDGARVAIRNVKEDVDCVSLEVAVDKDGIISSDEVSVDFEHGTLVCGIEISATKQ